MNERRGKGPHKMKYLSQRKKWPRLLENQRNKEQKYGEVAKDTRTELLLPSVLIPIKEREPFSFTGCCLNKNGAGVYYSESTR